MFPRVPLPKACTVRVDLFTLQWASIQLKVVFLYIVKQHSAAILSCGRGFNWHEKCMGFQLSAVVFKLKLQTSLHGQLSEEPVQQLKFKNTLYLNKFATFCFFLYVQNAEMFLKQNKQYYIFKTVLDNTLNFWFKRILTTARGSF